MILTLVAAGQLSAQALTFDLAGNGTNTNGFYYWQDGANWNQGGTLPGTADSARLRSAGKEKVFLTGDQSVSTLAVAVGTAGQVGGLSKLSLSTYLFMSDCTLDIRGSVSVVVSNRIRFGGASQAIILHDNAHLDARVGIDSQNTRFSITMNGNSVFDHLIAPSIGSNSIAAGSSFVLNGSSAVNANTLTALELHDVWMVKNTRFYLNDAATMTLQVSTGNVSNIASYLSSGYFQIKGSSNAVRGVDYAYDDDTGILKVLSPSASHVTNGLVLYMDASESGNDPSNYWKPISGGSANSLAGYLYGCGQMHKPYLKSDPVSGGHLWYYRIEADSTGGGQIGGFGSEVNFDYDRDFTVEAWIRTTENCPEPVNGRGVVFSDKSGSTGYRFGVRNDGTGKYYMELLMRDTTGPVLTAFRGTGVSGCAFGTWYHVVATYDGRTGDGPIIKFYKDGVSAGSYTGAYEDSRDPDFIPEFNSAAIGAKTFGTGGYYFDGDIAKVRVYNRILDATEVQQNYNENLRAEAGIAPSNTISDPGYVPPVENLDQSYPTYTQGPHREKMKYLPVSRRRTVFIDPDLYFCRVDVCKTLSGKLVCTFLAANDHSGSLFSNVVVSESPDNGHTWTFYRTIMYGSYDLPKIQCLSDGRLVITVRGGPINWSYDEGATWIQAPYPEGTDKMRELSNGDLVIPAQRFRSAGSPNEELEETLRRSYDNGISWWPIPDVVQSAYRKFFDEGSVWELPNRKLAAYCREDNYRYYPMFLNFSTDFGHTWTSPQMSPLFGHRPAGGNLAGGRTLLTYRQIGGDVGYVAWLGSPEQDRNVFPIVARDIENRINLQADRIVMNSGAGDNAATMYTMPPTSTPADRIVMETEMRCLMAGADGCVICPGVVFNMDPAAGRVYLREDTGIGFSVNVTEFHTYKFDRNGSWLKVWCDGVLQIDRDISSVMAMTDPSIILDANTRPGMYIRAENGRNVLFGNWPYYRWSANFYRNNTAHSEWKSMKVDVYAEEFPSYHWQWDATSGVYPDQYLRDRQIMLETEGSYKQSDCGYGSWVQLDDGTILVMNYTRGDGRDMPVQTKPFIRSYFLYEEDFVIPSNDEMLYLNANAPGGDSANVWEPVTGSGGTLYKAGAVSNPVLQIENGRSYYHFDNAPQSGGGVKEFSTEMNFNYDSDFTIEAWIRPQKSQGTAGRMSVFGNQLQNGCGYRLTAREGADSKFLIEFEMRDNAGTGEEEAQYDVRSKAVADMNTWCHIVAVSDGTAEQVPNMKIYINTIGQEIDDYRSIWVPPTGKRDFIMDGQVPVIGMRGAGTASLDDDTKYWFGGDIAMVRVYNKALTAAEIVDAYRTSSLSALSLERPQITHFTCSANAGFILSGHGSAGQPYRVFAATNLMLPLSNWTVLGTGAFAGGTFSFTDEQATNYPQRFYRLETP